jgi:ATP-binding cassette, subfamily B, bacterial MsbA
MFDKSSAEIVSNRKLYARLLTYLTPYWKAFVLAIFSMCLIAATEPVFPYIMKYLLDTGFKATDPRLVWLFPAGIVLLFSVRGILSFCTSYLMTWVSANVVTDVRKAMFEKMLTLQTQAFHEYSPSKFISKIAVDTGHLSDAVTNTLITAVRESLTAIALLLYLFYLNWQLTLLTLIIAPLLAAIVYGFSKRMRASTKATLESVRNLFHSIEETASAHKVVKIYGGQKQQSRRFNEESNTYRRATMKEAIPASAITPITHLAASLAVALIIYLALSQSTGEASISAGGFISFITALLMLISPIKQLTTISSALNRGLASCESVFSFLDMTSESDVGEITLNKSLGKIEFRDVNFKYPDSEKLALKKINFVIEPGQTVALVGASGGGKTTVSGLLPRFYNPLSGQILIDDININDLKLSSLRSNIALVSQDIVLFNDTIEANIAYGSHNESSREQIIAAAKAANAWEFIQQLPFGLETSIGESGMKLSGGQRQRIAIARALLKNCPILILDEATSALDTESERLIQVALQNLMKNRSTLVIAHRLSTIEHAHEILVLDQGQIIESGTHQELMALGHYYAGLNKIQT